MQRVVDIVSLTRPENVERVAFTITIDMLLANGGSIPNGI